MHLENEKKNTKSEREIARDGERTIERERGKKANNYGQNENTKLQL